ncbi:hypothetical protein [Parachlamydia acanthamoebae]|uniref:hypothetical protein n=1 Tax=Parachlamydia acanthamoebae TaxID=83552 RepID=UPI0001C17A81|nr:hypothetical protein [Parachlamydia acanthamoebae]EFB42027.1 hypothetical protein pah_c016o068 [Parachlamydia acanthamoebae str. Hall's coccus]
MRLFDKKTTCLILAFCLPLLFFPKINLIKFSEKETAGIRLDDVILLGTFFILFWARFSLKTALCKFEKWLFAVVGFSLFSFFCNRFLVSIDSLHVHSKIFYCLRILEYATFFYVGCFAYDFVSERKIMYGFLVWNLAIMAMQKVGLIGGFSSAGYGENTYRVTGIASFPSETGAILNLLFCYLVFDDFARKRIPIVIPRWLKTVYHKCAIFVQFVIFAIFVILSGSRIALAALLVPFMIKLKSLVSLKSIIIVASFLGCLSIGIAYLVVNTEGLRSDGLLSYKNIEIMKQVWEDIDIRAEPEIKKLETDEKFDQSWWMRMHKWCYALKIYLANPQCYLQGIGPGFAFPALDGGFLRILTENGLIGTFLYAGLFLSISKQSKQLTWMVIVFMVNMIFFDVYLAYKPMALLFLISGYAYARSLKEEPSYANFEAVQALA